MMENFVRASSGDCQAADSTTTTPTTTAAVTAINNPVSSSQQQRATSSSSSLPSSSVNHSEDVSSTTTSTTAVAAAKSATPPTTATRKLGASPPPPMTVTHVSSNNNGGNNKLKSQLQQQKQQQQNATAIKVHQFRAPQQFAKHKKATATLAKKNKTWNKRQNKGHPNNQQQLLQQQQQQQGAGNAPPAGGAGSGLGLAAVVGGCSMPATKADLENIQNIKNQLGNGGGGHHHQYYHHHGGHHGGRGGGGNTGNGIASCLCSLEKLGFGHGHLKQQQLYKKMLAHRGHHHHVLCSGATHNASGGGNPVCCLANGCSVPNGKDSLSLNSHNNSSHPNATHYCCGRSKFFLPDKRPRKEIIIPPTKFLLGGTISDPLNLNSLQNENASSNNNTPATTPRQSPITTPPKVEVIIPPNIHDPLHLLDPVDSMEYEKQLTSPMKRKAKPSAKKHRHRKNRKPKRRRYESYNSTSLEDDALSLGGSVVINSSSLANSSSLTESISTTMNSSMSTSLVLVSAENSSATGVDVVAKEGDEECRRDSPAPSGGGAVELVLSSSVAEQLEKNIVVGSPIGVTQQHVASSTGEPSVVSERESLSMRVRRSSERERVSKDLRLDLSVCCGVGGVGGVGGGNNNSSNNINSNSASSSTCGSIATLGSGGGLAGGRKRKISESNNSQKNKKFHRLDAMDKIVSPVVPQPGAWKRPPRLVPTGARKPVRRSTSVSEPELLSPADETSKLTIDTESNRGDTPDISKMESVSEGGLGSPLSTASGATSIATGEQDSILDASIGEVIPGTKGGDSLVATADISSTAAPNTDIQLTKAPKFRPDGPKYQYGNYDRHAGFRGRTEFMDVRFQVFRRHLELFKNKDILDIGCNVGHMTIAVARSLMPKSILGIDIDKQLVARARHSLSLYVRIPPEPKANQEMREGGTQEDVVANKMKKTRRQRKKTKQQHPHQFNATVHAHHRNHYHHLLLHHHHHQHHQHPDDSASFFPVSFPISYGGIPEATVAAATPSTSGGTPGNAATSGGLKSKNEFPKNVFFRHANYVLKDETQLNNDSQQYDLIMCLSVTKWIHLNFGDNGLKLAFKRMFNQLRPGGKLILEAQNWASYKKKRNLTQQIHDNYNNIKFFPSKFHEYLLSSDVGFSHSYTLGVPRHYNKGFCRPIQLYAKGDYTPNHVRWSDAYYPQTPYEAYRGIYATMPSRPHPLISSSRSQSYDTPHHPGIGGGGGGGVAPGSSSSYSARQTPMHQPTSQYYNPLETDSYLPSYDMEYLNHLYVFASPLYQTIWSPPASLRNSSTHTPLFGSVREAELDGDISSGGGASGGSYHRHVYPPNDDTSSPNANAGGAFNSIRDPDTDDSNQLPASNVQHVYATNCESSSSPQVLHAHESLEPIDETLMLADVTDEVGITDTSNCCGDSNEA